VQLNIIKKPMKIVIKETLSFKVKAITLIRYPRRAPSITFVATKIKPMVSMIQ
jgi:hypothetical protein